MKSKTFDINRQGRVSKSYNIIVPLMYRNQYIHDYYPLHTNSQKKR